MAKKDQFGNLDAAAFREIASLAGQVATSTEIYRENLRQVNEYTADIKDALTGQNRAALDLQKVTAEQLRNKANQKRIEKSLEKTQGIRNQLLSKQNELQKKISEDQGRLSDNKKRAAKLEAKLVGLSGKAKKAAAARLALAKEGVIENEQQLKKTQEAADITREALGDNERLLGTYKAISEQIKIVNSKTKFFDRLKDAVKSIPGAGPLISGPFEKAAEAANEAAASGKGIFATYAKGFSALSGAVLSLALVTVFTKSIFEADKQVTSLSKNLTVSKDRAVEIRKEMAVFSRNVGSAAASSETLMKAYQQLAPSLGEAVVQNDELLVDFADSVHLLGLTEASAARIAEISQSLGGSMTTFNAKAIKAGSTVEGINVSAKDILTDISELSSETLINFGRNPEELGRAVVEARKLGISLEKVNQIGESLLNFESSIGAELEAELLTGKELNLEKARLAALTGDQAALMKEVAEQAGSLAEFEEMNVLARQSLAQSLGMSVGEMGTMLLRQEAIAANSDLAAKASDEQLRYAQRLVDLGQADSIEEALLATASQVDATKQLELTMIKVRSILADLSLKAMPFINAFATGAALVAKHFEKILAVAIAYKAVQMTINTVQAIQTAMAARQLALEEGGNIAASLRVALEGESMLAKRLSYLFSLRELFVEKFANREKKTGLLLGLREMAASITSAAAKMMGASAMTLGIAAAVGLAAGAAAYAFLKPPTQVGDMGIDPNGGPVAYDPNSGGLFQGKKSDGMSMGPEFGVDGGPSSGGQAPAGMVAELKAIRKTLELLATKEGTVYIDGNEVGKALALATYRSS